MSLELATADRLHGNRGVDTARAHAVCEAPEPMFATHRLIRQPTHTIVAPRAGELHLWRFRSEWLPVTMQESDSWLSKAERERARLPPSAAQRKRFIATRLVLRWIVGNLFGCAPRAVEFQEDGDERLRARHPHDGRDIAIDVAYGGIWIIVGMATTPLGLGVAVPSLSMQAGDAGHARKLARYSSLMNALHHVHDAVVGIDPDMLNDDASSSLFDLAEHGRWHLIDVPMPGKIRASVALAQPVTLVQAFGWPKISAYPLSGP